MCYSVADSKMMTEYRWRVPHEHAMVDHIFCRAWIAGLIFIRISQMDDQ